jgi:Mce-associated membrane protein
MARPDQRAHRRPPRVAGQRRAPLPGAPTGGDTVTTVPPERSTSYAEAPTAVAGRPKDKPRRPRERRSLPRPHLDLRRITAPLARLGDVIALALIAAVVVLATLAGLFLQGWWHADAKASARDAAVTASKTGVTRVLSYDYRHFDADVASASKMLTTKFRPQYQQTQTQSVRKPALLYKAAVTADVVAAGAADVKSASHVVVLLFVDQTASNTKLAAPRIDRSRVRVDMRKVSGHWLVNSVTPL